MKKDKGGLGCLLAVLWVVLFPFVVLKELLKISK